jgi:hypothetical protein
MEAATCRCRIDGRLMDGVRTLYDPQDRILITKSSLDKPRRANNERNYCHISAHFHTHNGALQIEPSALFVLGNIRSTNSILSTRVASVSTVQRSFLLNFDNEQCTRHTIES